MRPIIALVWLLSLVACHPIGERSSTTVVDRQIVVDGSPYFIRGMCYHPVPKGKSERDFSQLDQDLSLMQELGVNTIRFYQPVDDVAVLDKIASAGIKVIISFGYNQGGYYDILSANYTNYIMKYKGHPAILLWEFGNEYNYHPEWFGGDIRVWYNALNAAVLTTKELDPAHATATAHGELPDSLALTLVPDVDIWGMNVYRWDTPADIFCQWQSLSSKPMYLSEAGADSYMSNAQHGYKAGPNEKAQADATQHILQDVFDHNTICSGITIFSFVDEWWKSHNDATDTQSPDGFAPASGGVPYDGVANEEYWGIVDIDRNKKEAFEVVKSFFDAE